MRRGLWPLGLVLAAAAVVAALALLGGEDSEGAGSHEVEPGVLEHVDGESVGRVVLTPSASQRIGLETTPVRAAPGGVVVPYSALIYRPEGGASVYTSPERLVFVREPVTVARIQGDLAYLSGGVAAGTDVVTVGAIQLYGVEFDVGS